MDPLYAMPENYMVGNFSTTDPEPPGEVFTYGFVSIPGVTDEDGFRLVAGTVGNPPGPTIAHLITTRPMTAGTYQLVVRTTDAGGASYAEGLEFEVLPHLS